MMLHLDHMLMYGGSVPKEMTMSGPQGFLIELLKVMVALVAQAKKPVRTTDLISCIRKSPSNGIQPTTAI